MKRSYGLFVCWLLLFSLGCRGLVPQAIDTTRVYDSPLLLDNEPQIQRGEPRKAIDAIGWVWGIPNKLLLWNRRVENHKISVDTEASVANYLYANQMPTVRVRLNQYRPREDWSRLVRNKSVGAGWRYTFGAMSVLGETLIPGRIFGGDHFNPFTNTVHIYSDLPAIAMHEGAHAKDFSRRRWKGTYAAVYVLPIVPLYHESIASRDVVAYLETHGSVRRRLLALSKLPRSASWLLPMALMWAALGVTGCRAIVSRSTTAACWLGTPGGAIKPIRLCSFQRTRLRIIRALPLSCKKLITRQSRSALSKLSIA